MYFVVYLSAGRLVAQAQSPLDRVYARVAGGAEWLEDTQVKELFGSVPAGTKMKFDLGSRTITTAGYKLSDWSAVELDFGSTQNSLRQITGGTRHEAQLFTIPVLLNAKLSWPNRSPLTPYLAAGVGGAALLLYVDDLEYGGNRASGFAPAGSFAYQAMAGLRYRLSHKLGLSVEYRYTGMEGADFELSDITSRAGRSSDRSRLGRFDTHTVSLGLDANF